MAFQTGLTGTVAGSFRSLEATSTPKPVQTSMPASEQYLFQMLEFPFGIYGPSRLLHSFWGKQIWKLGKCANQSTQVATSKQKRPVLLQIWAELGLNQKYSGKGL